MKKIIAGTAVSFMLLMNFANAQDYNNYKVVDAEMVRVKGDNWSEKKLNGVIVALPNNSNQLTVKLSIPYSSLNDKRTDVEMAEPIDFPFTLKIWIRPWKVQKSLTSSKTFDTEGLLTLNDTTKPVIVEYTPLPSLTAQDGGFNINIIIKFNPGDFDLEDPDRNDQFYIKIGDAPVNRL
ncbi:MAG: hypothetical protein M3N30_03835 [Bacteroidota bacterium]|nr:hypothetical protein [Bacteroidota bacterium]